MSTNQWADYLISATRYNLQHTHIEYLRVHQDLGDRVGNGQTWEREKVVSSIVSGRTFITIREGSNGKWLRGEDVRPVRINGKTYLRTDNNQTPADNLGNLPEL